MKKSIFVKTTVEAIEKINVEEIVRKYGIKSGREPHENNFIEEDNIEIKGGPGSGNYDGPGKPRFAHQSNPESVLTGHERFHRGSTSGVQAGDSDLSNLADSYAKNAEFYSKKANKMKEGKYSKEKIRAAHEKAANCHFGAHSAYKRIGNQKKADYHWRKMDEHGLKSGSW